MVLGKMIYNSRNYSILLNRLNRSLPAESTTVEIILYYLTKLEEIPIQPIYNSRNYSILLNAHTDSNTAQSTTVEIILYYLTPNLCICTIFWSQATLFLLFYITFAQYMLSNIDYYKIKVQVCITL